MPERLVAFALAGAAASGCESTPNLPPDLARFEESFFGHEPALWQPANVEGYRQRLRLVFLPGLIRFQVVISIDQYANGTAVGRFTRREDARGHFSIAEERRFTVKPEDIASLDAILAQKQILQNPREFWVNTGPDVLCIDGIEVMLEHATPDGYRFAEANVQCAAPSDFFALATIMIEAAGGDIGATTSLLD